MTFSTYYPAPYGRYRQFSTTSKTTLATDEHNIEANDDIRVGIGTTNPQVLLHVQRDQNDSTDLFISNDQLGSEAQSRVYLKGNSGGGILTYRNENFSAFSRAHFADRLELRSDAQAQGISFTSGKPDADMRFYTGGDMPSNERMRITSNGDVGIGTVSPKSKLHVMGLPVYADNAAAIAASPSLTVGAFYRTSDGTLKVVY